MNSYCSYWMSSPISIADNELLLRRTVNRNGPSRAYINTTAVPLQLLRDIGSLLIDIHGQHEHQRLLKRDEQRELLDGFGNYGDITLQVNRAYEKWDAVNRELRSLTEPDGETGDRISLLRYQVQELQALELEENEVERLEDEYKRLFNINTLLETTQQALDGLYAGEQSVNDRINAVKRELASLERFDSGPAGINALLENASVHVAEAADELRSYLGRLGPGPRAPATGGTTPGEVARHGPQAPGATATTVRAPAIDNTATGRDGTRPGAPGATGTGTATGIGRVPVSRR